MKLEFDTNGKLLLTLTGAELFRAGRGDVIEYGEDVLYPRGMQIVCESPQSLELVDDLKFEARRFERQLAVLKSELWAMRNCGERNDPDGSRGRSDRTSQK